MIINNTVTKNDRSIIVTSPYSGEGSRLGKRKYDR